MHVWMPMYTGRVAPPASDVCDEAQCDQAMAVPTKLYQAPRQPAAPAERAKRYRTKSVKRGATLKQVGTVSTGSQCGQQTLDMKQKRQEADLENVMQVNQTLKRLQAAAHRHLEFVQDRIAKYQAGYRQLEAQNQQLQRAIHSLTADMHDAGVAGQGHVDGEEADACSQASSAEFMHLPFSEVS